MSARTDSEVPTVSASVTVGRRLKSLKPALLMERSGFDLREGVR